MNVKVAVLLLVAIFLPSLLIQGQSSQALLQGNVLDASRAPISGAKVIAVAHGADSGPADTTDEDGHFSLRVPAGRYTLKISALAFSEFSEAVELHAAASESRQFVLAVAGIQESVTITESLAHQVPAISSSTKTLTPLRDVPQSVTVVGQQQVKNQLFTSVGDLIRYIPGITAHQGENNRDQVVIRGNSSSADFFLNGVRDDVQYYRDLYNLDHLEALKGPNALAFGRGGGGGVINRVTKQAGFAPFHELTVQGGSYNSKRLTTDINEPLADRVAFRLNGMFENSASFRNDVSLERFGINPTVTITPRNATMVSVSYETLRDNRTADRGIPSFHGRPADVPVSTFFGDPNQSRVHAQVNLGAVTIEHQVRKLTIRNRMHAGQYDRSYQNFVPGSVSGDGAQVALSAYNNATRRLNVFNQTDLIYETSTGGIHHLLLGGAEVGRQLTDNFRNTGFFNDAMTSTFVSYTNPTLSTPVTFRQSASDADNHLRTNLAAVYVQDQIVLSRYVQLVTGLRFDQFDLQYHNNRTNENLRRIDNLTSPRAGVVVKPITAMSLYGNYSISYLPSSGDQFSSLTTITQQVKPEKFSNYELGMKWDIRRQLSLTSAVYRLDRTNTRATDPANPTRIVQTGSQRTNGYEIGANGNVTSLWEITGGYAYQDAFVTSATASARDGAQVAQVPHHTFSFWSNYRFFRRLGLGIGVIHRSSMYAAIDNSVVLPGYSRADSAVFFSLTEKIRIQGNVENVFNKKYYVNADSNTNISPGVPRAVKIALTTRF